MVDVLDTLRIDVGKLIGQLPQDTLGVFEPASGVMYLNVDDATFDAWRAASREEDDLSHVFHHELYHYVQTITTGYQFSLTLSFYEAFSREFGSFRRFITPAHAAFVWQMIMAKVAFWRSPDERVDRLAAALTGIRVESVLKLPGSRRPDDRSMMGAYLPRLFEKLEKIHGRETEASANGLSAADVVEGAAVAYEILVRHEEAEDAAAEFLARADTSHPEHVPAFAAIRVIRAVRPAELLLAASALAMRFEKPNAVLEPIARMIADAPPSEEEEGARQLERGGLRDLPGGRYLGTAVEVRRRLRPGYKLYDKQLDALRDGAWGADELGLLTSRHPLRILPPGQLGLAIVTRESFRGMDAGEASARLIVASTLLRHHSLRSHLMEVGMEMRDLILGVDHG